MKKIISGLLAFCCCYTLSAQVSIIPKPVSLTESDGSFILDNSVRIVAKNKNLEKQINFLNDYLVKFYGFKLKERKKGGSSAKTIVLENISKNNSIPGAYSLEVSGNSIVLKGDDPQGVFYGIQTLIQLLPVTPASPLSIPNVKVTDAPRFVYRGMHMDVARHFFSVDFVKKYIDFLALHKFNTFHWHLTDDQGWRIEIKKYPRLTEVGGCRNGTITGHHPGNGNDSTETCGYYTQQQIKDVVKYAADRFITVIPEIEMPGHSSAAIAAYPQLSCFPGEPTKPAKDVVWSGATTGKQVQQAWGIYPDVYCPSEYTFNFLENVLDEIIELFPSKYIHIGGDECPKEAWKRSEFCHRLIKEKGLKDEHELQSYFVGRIEKYLNSKGRDIIGWDEILEGGLAPNATVMSWRGEKGGIEAARQKHKVIMTPSSYVYFDRGQNKNEDSLIFGGYVPIEKVYSYNPVPAELSADQQQYVIGAQANLWTEYISNPRKAQYMIFPRMSALSEVLWTPFAQKDWDDFKRRLQMQMNRYDLWKVNYNTFPADQTSR